MIFQYYMPTHIIFGPGALRRLARAGLPGKKALIVTGGVSTEKYRYIDRLQKLLKRNAAAIDSTVYRGVGPNPTLENAEECAALAREAGCDFLVALGGGSSIDTAKAAALLAVNEGELWEYVSGGTGKGKKAENPPLPVVAIPTTAGTGSEVNPWMVLTKQDGNEKIGFGGPKSFPVLSVVDPDLMATVPPKLTAFQGFDAFFHAVEGYISRMANPMSDMLALKSIELIAKNLGLTVKKEKDSEALACVALASTLSGIVEGVSSCTSHHSIEHTLSAFYPDLPHGAGLILLSKAYFERVAPSCPERFVEIAKAMGESDAKSPADFLNALERLKASCGVSGLRMSDYGIETDRFGEFAQNAMETGASLFACDRAGLELQDVISIYERSYS